MSALSHGGDGGRATAYAVVEYHVARIGVGEDKVAEQFDRLLCEVQHLTLMFFLDSNNAARKFLSLWNGANYSWNTIVSAPLVVVVTVFSIVAVTILVFTITTDSENAHSL